MNITKYYDKSITRIMMIIESKGKANYSMQTRFWIK